MLSRRDFLKTASVTSAGLTVAASLPACNSHSPDAPAPVDERNVIIGDDQIDPGGQGQFAHGVASGDPYANSVVLWTRFTPTADADITVTWEAATDPAFTNIITSGSFVTQASRDYTVKVIANGLQPATTYYYRFAAFGAVSVIGRTRTAPSSNERPRLRFASASCAWYSQGYFNVYRSLAARADLDAVLHLGDYLYEYGGNEATGQGVPGRGMQPGREITTLDDYRTRHAQYKSDVDLQECHRQHPFVCVWDDHEFTNDSHRDGADNHTEGAEGVWNERKQIAIQAYFEWLPVREAFNPLTNPGEHLHRVLNYGNLVDIIMLDTRIEGRDEQIGSAADADLPKRGMLNESRENWFFDQLENSSAQWKLIGQQTMLSQLFVSPDLSEIPLPGTEPRAFTLDSWDGYNWQRQRILDFIRGDSVPSWDGLSSRQAASAINNFVILAGDIHTPFGCDLTSNPNDATTYTPATAADGTGGQGSVGVEFVCASVSSIGFPPGAPVQTVNPHMRYASPGNHGYCLLDIDANRCQCEWYHTVDVLTPTGEESFDGMYQASDGVPYLVAGTQQSTPDANAPALAP